MTTTPQKVRRNAQGPRHTIRDAKALSLIIRDLLQAPQAGFGSVDSLAKATKINRSTWYRLLSGNHTGLAHRVALHLERLIRAYLGENGRKRFLEAMTFPGTKRVHDAYRAWARERQGRLWSRTGPLWELRAGSLPRRVAGRGARELARHRLGQELEAAIRAEVPEYIDFERWMQSRFLGRDRALVSKMRILEPFLEAPESGFVELGWEDLPKEERREFVRSAIIGERWLLARRGSSEMRAEQLAKAALLAGT